MKNSRIKINSGLMACLIVSVALPPVAYAKQVLLNPVDGVSLQDIMARIGVYRTCMDQAQTTASRGKAAYKQAQLQQCNEAFVSLSQSMDKQSFKSIDHLSWQ